jgi:peptidoglycan-associated lipoprotein
MKLTTFIIPALLLVGVCLPKTSFANCGETASASVVIPAPEDIFFEYNKADLSLESILQLRSNARWYVLNGTTAVIEGHCDERGSRAYNLGLGESRAEVAREYMVWIGVDPSTVKTVAVGEEKPFLVGHTESDWALNRRDHFVTQ